MKLSLHINAFLKQDTLKKRVLVAQHQALICGATMCGLEVVQIRLVDSDSLFELFDILGSPFSEGGLRLAVSLLAFLRRSVDWLAPALALGRLALLRCCHG